MGIMDYNQIGDSDVDEDLYEEGDGSNRRRSIQRGRRRRRRSSSIRMQLWSPSSPISPNNRMDTKFVATMTASIGSTSSTHHGPSIGIESYRVIQEAEEVMPKLLLSGIKEYDTESIWSTNYTESSIFLEEGQNNEKLDTHPKNTDQLYAYQLIHNRWYYVLDLVASLVVLCLLPFIEPPTMKQLHCSPYIGASIELICLLVISIECWMKLKWMGPKAILSHTRTIIKIISLLLMMIDCVVVLFVPDREDYRIIRFVRPVCLIDNHFCYTIRRTLRHLLQSLRPILDIIMILFLIIGVFSLVAFYLFRTFSDNRYFTTVGEAFSSLFIIIANGNFPDVMMPVYNINKSAAVFFVCYMIIQLYFVLNMMLAVSYEKYSSVAKDKFRKLFLHRRLCARHAFRLLCSDTHPHGVTFKRFEGVCKLLKPNISSLRCYLMFKLSDVSRSGILTLDDFYRIYDSFELNWTQVYPEVRWFSWMKFRPIIAVMDMITTFSKSKSFESVIDYILGISLFYEVFKATEFIPRYQLEYEVIYSLFIGLFVIESVIKIIGYGFITYISRGWNTFDFIVSGLSMIGHYIRPFNYNFGYFYLLRTFRILRVFNETQRYKHIMGPFVFIVFRQMTHFSVIVYLVLFSFSIIGMNLFASTDLHHLPPTQPKEMNELYQLFGFRDFANSFFSLLILSFTYLWGYMLDRYSTLISPWTKLYFMSFYVISTVVLKIVISSILEAFLFVMKCHRKLDDIEEQTRVSRDIMLTSKELRFLGLESKDMITDTVAIDEDDMWSRSPKAIFRGEKLRTKFSFSCKMYEKEMQKWIQDEESFDSLLKFGQTRRRAYSNQL